MPSDERQKVVYDYPRPALTVDVVLATREDTPRVLLIKRKHAPDQDCWALPGGFVNENERLGDAAARELVEETNVHVIEMEQLLAAGDPGRDPRGWTVSIVYLARVDECIEATASDDAKDAAWFRIDDLPPLAFDHAMILEKANERIMAAR